MLFARSEKRNSILRPGIMVLLALLAIAPVSFAQTAGQAAEQDRTKEEKKSYLYQWTDSKGVVHITDDPGSIPEKYRDKVRKLQSPKGEAPSEEGQTGPAGGAYQQNSEATQKAEWQQRMRRAKQRLADAKKRHQELETRRLELLSRWGTPAYAPPEARLEAERLGKEEQDAQKEIDDARNEIENVIPEDARKAGIPPGWLRE